MSSDISGVSEELLQVGALRTSELETSFRDNTKASIASLATQIRGIESDYTDLKVAVLSLDKKLDSGLQAINHQLNTSIQGLNTKLDERGKTDWSALGVMLAAFIAFVGFAYWPINNSENELKLGLTTLSKDFGSLLNALPETYVTHKQEAGINSQVSANADKIQRISEDLTHNFVGWREHERLMRENETSLNAIRKDMVTRSEHEQHWAANKEREDAIQKQIDVMRTDFGGVWTTRDQLQRLQHEIDVGREAINRFLASQGVAK